MIKSKKGGFVGLFFLLLFLACIVSLILVSVKLNQVESNIEDKYKTENISKQELYEFCLDKAEDTYAIYSKECWCNSVVKDIAYNDLKCCE